MRYDSQEFNSAVRYYQRKLDSKNILIIFDVRNERAYYSIAPLSRAAHNIGADVYAIGIDEHSTGLDVLLKTWDLYDKTIKDHLAQRALMNFIAFVSKRIKGFEKLFIRPDMILRAGEDGFTGRMQLAFRPGWLRKYHYSSLLETSRVIFDQVYNLKNGENTGIGFELIPKHRDMDNPLQDYLDSYQIAKAMEEVARAFGRTGMFASTPRFSLLEPMNRIGDLRAVLMGCEMSKDIDKPVFKIYKRLSHHIRPHPRINDANFFVSGKGYGGKHAFGQVFGYPDPKKRTSWTSPAMIAYQLNYQPQTALDEREPVSRVGFTSTIPIDTFIRTCNIDWHEMDLKNQMLMRIADRCDRIIVDSKDSSFEVGLRTPDGKQRLSKNSGGDLKEKIDKNYLLRTGIAAGNMANLPGGEMFLTPEYVKGRIVGDVIISIDRSYKLSPKDPLIVQCSDDYKIIRGPKKVLKKLAERKSEAKKTLKLMEKTLPKKLIELKKKNFNKIGEFAINTNPKARLCNYLIVNEKIAGMIHVALGSGFDPDRTTEYHCDIVINARRQKLDIYGTDGQKKIWMMKKGHLCV